MARARVLLGVALGPSVASAAIVTALVLLTLVASGSDLSDVGAAAAASWLAAHQVPLTIAGSPLSVLPLLPTALLVWTTARSTAAPAAAGEDPRWVASAAVAGPLIFAVLALTMTHVLAGGLPLQGPPAAPTLIVVVGVHLVGAALGLMRRAELRARVRRSLPDWAADGALLLPRTLRNLLVGSGIVTAFCLVCALPTAANLVGSGGGFSGGLGLIVLSVAYLPNVVVGAASVAIGPGAVVGPTTVTAFGAVHAPLPAVPVLAVVPQGDGAWWWLAVLLVPAIAAVQLGRAAVQRCPDRDGALRSVGAAAVLAGLVFAVLGALAGGTLGTGAFSPVGVPAPALGALTAVWLALVGAVTVLVLQWRSARAQSPDLAEQPEPAAD